MADDREKISTGPNDEPLNETIAGTGPGIPDEALAPGEKNCPSRRATRRSSEIAEKLGLARRQNETHFRWKVNELRDGINARFCNRSVCITI